MLDSRKQEADEEGLIDDEELAAEAMAAAAPDSDDDDDALSIADRRARRRAKRTSESDSDQESSAVTTAKDKRTPTQKDAMKARKRQAQTFGENIPVLGGIVGYLRGVNSEIRKVTWPTREESRRLTLIVVAVTIMFAIFLGIFDLFYGRWFQEGVQNTTTFLIVGAFFFVIGGGLSWYFILREDV